MILFVISFFLELNASASEIGPILPKNIVDIIIILPQIFKKAVKFLVSPTVAVALTVSYKISINEASQTDASKIVEINKIINDIQVTATAFLVACFDKLRLKIVISFLFFIVAKAVEIKTTIVTVFTPPAVPMGEPPINIKRRHIIAEAFVKFSCGIVANPAVLVVTD